MALKDILIQDQRLVILRSLMDAGYDANESIISDCLDLYGHDISRDLVRNHLSWLEEQGLVTVQRLQKNMPVSTYTLDRLCKILDCRLDEVAEYLPDEEAEKINKK